MTPSLPDQDRADGMQRGLNALLDAGRRHNTATHTDTTSDESVGFISSGKDDPGRWMAER